MVDGEQMPRSDIDYHRCTRPPVHGAHQVSVEIAREPVVADQDQGDCQASDHATILSRKGMEDEAVELTRV